MLEQLDGPNLKGQLAHRKPLQQGQLINADFNEYLQRYKSQERSERWQL